MSRLPRVAAAALLLCCTTACGGSDQTPTGTGAGTPGAPTTTAFPTDLTAYVDQSRSERQGRSVFVRLVHDGEGEVTALRADVDSDRFGKATWTGEKSFTNEADLDFELPVGSCGTGSDADVRLTYRIDDGPELVSTTRATDRYGAIALFLDRDCAEQTMGEAADVTVGAHRVVGRGVGSVFEVDVAIAGTGAREDVSFGGFQGSVLFRTVEGTPVYPAVAPVPLVAGAEDDVTLRLAPGRCDPHALAEDKVGTLFGVHVVAPGLPEGAFYYLPISDETRADLRAFFGTSCGF